MQACEDLIRKFVRETNSLVGDLAEVGVWKGESAYVILQESTHGTLFLYDTFCGMPESMTLPEDDNKAGSFSDTSLRAVQLKLDPFADRCVFRPGVFPHTAQDQGPFRLVHVDCDQYLSTRAALDWFCPRMVEGGVLLLDDYLCGSTRGARRAIDEYLKEHECWHVATHGYRGVMTRALEAHRAH